MRDGSEFIGQLLSMLARMSLVHRIARTGVVAASLVLAGMVAAPGPDAARLLALAVLASGLALAAAPGSVALLLWGGLLGLWVLVHPMPLAQLLVVVALVWTSHRLARLADTGPSHAVVDSDGLRSVARDALVEFAWLVIAGTSLGLGLLLGPLLPGGAWWPLGLLALLAVAGMAWRSLTDVRQPTR
ncbi:MAG TPA: hypothetical protein H9987_00475 [Candidatus Luteococcus avicola]|nr:hypothetical protein [Candidatus Luteococcus avicola]